MLYFDRIDVSEGTDVTETSASKECDICHLLVFIKLQFQVSTKCLHRCHDLLMRSMSLIDTANLKIKGSDYRCSISLICKSEAINLMQNADLTGKSVTL